MAATEGGGGVGDAGGKSPAVDGLGTPESPLFGVVASSCPSVGFQRGHFFASAESSGISTISLSSHSKRLNGKVS